MCQSRSKLDLNNLLAKYEGGTLEKSFSASYLMSPAKSMVHEPVKDAQYCPAQQQYQVRVLQQIPENFSMSKSECQQFLLRIREQLKKQSKSLKFCSENAMKQVHETFQRQHQAIKRQILQLLERAFQQNEKIIREQLRKQGQIQPTQFIEAQKKISYFDDGVERLLHNLKSSQYRKAIAEVVLKDYNSQLFQLREGIKLAKDNYISNLGGTQIDRSRIECIKKDLQNLFTLNKRNSHLVGNAFLDVIQDKSQVNTFLPQSRVQSQQPKQEARKTFFNFLM